MPFNVRPYRPCCVYRAEGPWRFSVRFWHFLSSRWSITIRFGPWAIVKVR